MNGEKIKRVAVISDIHGNYKALEAFMEYLQEHPVDGVICLGDYMTDAPYTERTMALLYRLQELYPCYMLRGNREDYLLDNVDNHENWKPSSANGTLYYTSLHVTERDMEFFKSLPTERELALEGCPAMYLCHGTPGKVRGNMEVDEGLREQVMSDLPYDYLLGGHSHHQEVYVQDGKTYINPGSLGLAIDGVGRQAQFAVLTGSKDGWQAECHSIAYDIDSYLQDFALSGVEEMGMTLTKAIKKTLLTGVNYFFKCVLAMQDAAKEAGVSSFTLMPEEAWRRLEEKFKL